MFIYGLKNLVAPALQLAQVTFDKTSEFAKSFFKTIQSVVNKPRKLQIYSIVALGLMLPVVDGEILQLTNKCCSQGFFSQTLIHACEFLIKKSLAGTPEVSKISEIYDCSTNSIQPSWYRFNCSGCEIRTQELISWAGGPPVLHFETNCRVLPENVALNEKTGLFLIKFI